ncbi:MAG: hypothetical protein ABIZ04_16205 [Opitutus sp.]
MTTAAAPKFTVPAALPSLQVQSATALAAKAGVEFAPDAAKGAEKDQAANLLNQLLNENKDMRGATQVIAHGLSPQDGVKWAVDACRKVETKLSPAEHEAMNAADAFALAPDPIRRAAAGVAAAKVGMQSPAGLAAKAASMVDVPGAAPVPGADQLVPLCVAGAVACAVALSAAKSSKKPDAVKPAPAPVDLPKVDAAKSAASPTPPPGPDSPESAKNASAAKPFIDAGLALAAGIAVANSKI